MSKVQITISLEEEDLAKLRAISKMRSIAPTVLARHFIAQALNGHDQGIDYLTQKVAHIVEMLTAASEDISRISEFSAASVAIGAIVSGKVLKVKEGETVSSYTDRFHTEMRDNIISAFELRSQIPKALAASMAKAKFEKSTK